MATVDEPTNQPTAEDSGAEAPHLPFGVGSIGELLDQIERLVQIEGLHEQTEAMRFHRQRDSETKASEANHYQRERNQHIREQILLLTGLVQGYMQARNDSPQADPLQQTGPSPFQFLADTQLQVLDLLRQLTYTDL